MKANGEYVSDQTVLLVVEGLEKMKSFKQQQEREAKETLSSRDLAITKDTNE